MNKERLQHAIEVLKKVPARKFALGSWASFSEEDAEQLRQEQFETAKVDDDEDGRVVRINGCGMTACACGWVASDDIAVKSRFRMKVFLDAPYDRVDGRNVYESQLEYIDQHGQKHVGWDAALFYFDLDSRTARLLFDSESYVKDAKADAVIKRMEYLLQHGVAEFEDRWGDYA